MRIRGSEVPSLLIRIHDSDTNAIANSDAGDSVHIHWVDVRA
jgi:hypothetical protein